MPTRDSIRDNWAGANGARVRQRRGALDAPEQLGRASGSRGGL